MDGISVLTPSTPELQPLLYSQGNAAGWITRSSKTASAPYYLSGRLYLAKSGWLLLSVPNAFVRGLFDALTAPGAELPTAGLMNVPNVSGDVLNAHISVMSADEVKQIGADKINERGHMFHYGLGPVKEIPVANVDGVSKIWAVQVMSPALSALRKSYGLSPLMHGDHAFHITIAARRKHVLGNNEVSKFDLATGRGEWKAAEEKKKPRAVILKGNPKYVESEQWKPHADKFYAAIGKTLQDSGYDVDYDAAEPHTLPAQADLWVGHSRGVDRFAHAPKGQRVVAIGSTYPGAINHPKDKSLSKEMAADPDIHHFEWTDEMADALKKHAAADDKTTYDCACFGPCMCPETCGCKKHGKCGGAKTAEELPWRERVEVYTRHPQTGKIYGGVWAGDKSFAVPGGGIDPGETPEQAAIRELEEETGIKATNPVRLPVPTVDNPWSDKHRAETGRNFAGSRTHFVAVDFLHKLRNKQLDKWDATNRGFYDPVKAVALMKDKKFMAPAVAAGRLAAIKHIIENAAKKTAAVDLLHGGEADNMPDNAFSAKELAKGKKNEHEHTNNDQIADEIAKDHLQEDPDYYKKHAEEEVTKEPAIIFQLRKAKEHSDAKRYKQKNEILRRLMHRAPDDWTVDDPEPYHMGITHLPTRFRFHADPKIIPVGVPVQKAASKNPYLRHLFDFTQPLPVKPGASPRQMILAHLQRVIDKGNWTAQAQQNTPRLFAAMDPNYKHQMNMEIARGVWPQPDLLTQLIQRHGSGVLASLK